MSGDLSSKKNCKNKNIGLATVDLSNNLCVDRRQLVVGVAATSVAIAANSALAQESGPLTIRFVRDPERNNRFGILFSQKIPPLPDLKVAFFPENFFSDMKAPLGRKAGEKLAAAQPSFEQLAGLRIDNIKLSDRRAYSIAILVDDLKGNPKVSVELQLREGPSVESNKIPLDSFLLGHVAASLNLSASQVEDLRWDLFGDRLQFSGKSDATLSLKLTRPPQLKRADSIWEEPSFQLELIPKAGGRLTALEGSITLPGGLRIQRVASDAEEGAHIQLEQELAAGEAIRKRQRSPALIAEAMTPAESKKAKIEWVGQATRAKNARPKSYVIGESGQSGKRVSVHVQPIGELTAFTLRQWGRAHETLAILRGSFRAAVLSPSPDKSGDAALPAAEFLLQEGLLTQQASRPASGKPGAAEAARRPQPSARREVDETLIGRLQEKAFSIDTPIGPMVVEGDPPPQTPQQRQSNAGDAAKKTGVPAGKPEFMPVTGNPLGVQLDRRTEFTSRPAKGLTQFFLKARNDEITFFDARALLRQIAMDLPNTSDNAQFLLEAGNVWSRLDFSGVEIAFRLNLGQADNVWPSARGVVTLGVIAEAPSPLASSGMEAGIYKPGQAIIALDGAKLRVRRDSDNLALTFQFRNMALEIGGGKARIAPNLRLSGAGSGAQRPDLPGEAGARFDDRPLLIVDFPPQHVAEKVYYRQINDGIALPEVVSALDQETTADFMSELIKWRNEKNPVDKIKQREKLFNIEVKKDSSPNVHQDRVDLISQFYRQFPGTDDLKNWEADVPAPKLLGIPERWQKLPEDQRRYYLGASSMAMDPDARQVWLDLWREYQNAKRPVGGSDADARAEAAFRNLLSRAPDPELPMNFLSDIKKEFETQNPKPSPADQEAKTLEAICREKKKRNWDFDLFARLYEGAPDGLKKTQQGVEEETTRSIALKKQRDDLGLHEKYYGRDLLVRAWQASLEPNRIKISKYIEALIKEFEYELTGDPFKPVTPARLSGVSRLVFRFDSAGGSFDAKDVTNQSKKTEDLEDVRSIEFTLQGLTDWGRFDLAVTRRAETLEAMPGGRVPHPDMRAVDLDTSRILANQGIRPGRTIEGRLGDIEASLKAPSLTETAIELPFRLQLSPDQFGRFRTRRQIDREVLANVLADPPFSGVLPALWSANLQIGAVPPRVRAIWSDDFVPSALTAGAMPPARGPAAPWDRTARAQGRRNDFLTALDAYDRHEIVALSSVYGLPSMGRYSAEGQRNDPDQFEPPPDYRLSGLKLYEPTGAVPTPGAVKADLSSIYNPAPLSVSELRLTAFGGSLRHDSAFLPPASARREDGSNIFEAMSVERWRQYTVLGRDIEVEVVYKGYLFPLGIRAALVKLTERRFIRNQANGVVTAFLIQRKFVRIGKPDKIFPAMGQPNLSRRFPVHQLTMLTRETPDIVDPDIEVTGLEPRDLQNAGRLKLVSLRPNGAVDFHVHSDERAVAALCFWPRTKPGPEGNILFEFRLDADAAPLRMPLVFVDNRGVNNRDVLQALTKYYNAETGPLASLNEPLRKIKMGGASRRYAEENKDGECEFETFTWELRAEGRAEVKVTTVDAEGKDDNTNHEFDPFLQGAEQPPFYPYVHKANIRIGQAERFVGRALAPMNVEYVDAFRRDGFPAANDQNGTSKLQYLERYLQLSKSLKLDMGTSGDRSGGIGRPSMDIEFLSRRFGLMPKAEFISLNDLSLPINGTNGSPPPEPPPPSFNLEKFFAGDAKLLGIITFKELIQSAIGYAGSAMPELKEKVDAASDETAEFLRQKVLPEIENALKSLEQMWDNAQKALTSQSGATRGVASLDLDKIYPDIAPSLKELVLRVAQAKEAREIGDIVAAMSKVQTSGRKFVTVLNRTLADPVTPLREELRSKFRAVSGLIHAFGEGFGAVADELIKQAKEEALKLAQDTFLSKADVRPFLALVVALPVPEDVVGTPLGGEVVAALDGALVEGGKAFVESILTAGRLDEEATSIALEEALGAAKTKLDSAVLAMSGQAKTMLQAYQKKVDELIDELDSAIPTIKAKARERLRREMPGLLQPLFFDPDGGLLPDIRNQISNIERSIKAGGRDVLERIGRDLGKLLLTTAKAFVVQKAGNACRDQLAAFFELVKARLPAAATPAPAPGAPAAPVSPEPVKTIIEKLRASVPDSIRVSQEFKDSIELLEAAEAQLKSAQTAFQTPNADAVCQALLAPLAGAAPAVTPLTVPNQTLKRASEQLRYVRVDSYKALRTILPVIEKYYDNKPSEFIKSIQREIADLFVEIVSFAGAAGSTVDAAFSALDEKLQDAEKSAISVLQRQIAELRLALKVIRLDMKIFGAGLDAAAKDARAAAAENWDAAKPVESARKSLEAVRSMILILDGYTATPAPEERFRATFDSLKTKLENDFKQDVEKVSDVIRLGLASRIIEIENDLAKILAFIVTTKDEFKSRIIKSLAITLAPFFKFLDETFYKNVITVRNTGKNEIEGNTSSGGLIQFFLKWLKGPDNRPLTSVFTVEPKVGEKDQLDLEYEKIKRLSQAETTDYLENITSLAERWEKGQAAPELLVRNVAHVLTAVLKGDLAQFVDLQHIRREIDAAIRTMVPARIEQSYDLKLQLRDLGDLVLFGTSTDASKKEVLVKLGLPEGHPKGLPGQLVLRARGVIDLLQPNKSSFEAEGYMPAFAVQLLPAFDVATIGFPPTMFSAGPGKPFNISMKVRSVELGEKVSFIKDIQSILPAPKNGSGFYIKLMTGRSGIGIVAGYALPIGSITIGNMFIDNLALNVAAELPFDDGDARFLLSISRPEAPFMIAVAPYAGAGHFGLIANPRGIVGFEASFQFGGGGGFSFGPLTGKGRISVGVYIRQMQGLTDLYGVFYAGGSARIACFGVGAQLNVRMGQTDGGDVEGEAIFTYSFSVGVKDIEFSVTVFKNEKGSKGAGEKSDPKQKSSNIIDLNRDEFRELSPQYAQLGSSAATGSLGPTARLINLTQCRSEDFRIYKTYFARAEAMRPRVNADSATSKVWVLL